MCCNFFSSLTIYQTQILKMLAFQSTSLSPTAQLFPYSVPCRKLCKLRTLHHTSAAAGLAVGWQSCRFTPGIAPGRRVRSSRLVQCYLPCLEAVGDTGDPGPTTVTATLWAVGSVEMSSDLVPTCLGAFGDCCDPVGQPPRRHRCSAAATEPPRPPPRRAESRWGEF